MCGIRIRDPTPKGPPEEVAEAVVYLCAPEASFVNGAELVMDGGWTAR